MKDLFLTYRVCVLLFWIASPVGFLLLLSLVVAQRYTVQEGDATMKPNVITAWTKIVIIYVVQLIGECSIKLFSHGDVQIIIIVALIRAFFNRLIMQHTNEPITYLPVFNNRLLVLTFFIFMVLLSDVYGQDIYINKDTTINNTWNIPEGVILKFGSQGRINGKGTIRGGIIDASLNQWIFDTTLTIQPEGTYGKDFSAKWFGAGRVKDNHGALQKGINTVLANSGRLRNFFIPKGVYPYSKPLRISNIYKGEYIGATIHIYGESSFWDSGSGTTLRYTATDGFALGLQLNKGTEINNLSIEGQFKAPAGKDDVYYNTSFENYKDANGKCGDLYAGIVVDYDGSKNTSGSTGVKIHDVSVGNFTINYLVSPNGKTFNADILIFENIKCGDARIGFASGQAQEKGNVIRGIYSWGSIHTLISIGRYGKSQAGNYLIDGGNVAGRCIRLFDISQSGWYASSVANLYAESIATVGSITSQIPISISNSTFHFVFPSVIGKQTLFYSNTDKTKFSNCIFRYYGSKEPMKFAGNAQYDNCVFSGERIK